MRSPALLILLATACITPKEDTAAPAGDDPDTDQPEDSAEDTAEDTAAPDPSAVCTELDLPERAFDPTGPAAMQRWQPAGDFTVPLTDGSTWTLSERWSGCESYIFVPDKERISDLDSTPMWFTDLRALLRSSPPNVHYFFISTVGSASTAEENIAAMQEEIDSVLAGLDEDEADWWMQRLHVVSSRAQDVGGLVTEMADTHVGALGFAIDRGQRLRGLGYFAAVNAYDSALASAGAWPYESRLSSAASEAEYFNFEAGLEARLESETVTTIEVFGGDIISEYEDGTLQLPDAATMQGFDTLEIDVRMECPDRDVHEVGNCGAWDYLAGMQLWDEESGTWLEMGRFITTYHRESRWVVDATHALAWLQEGGDRTVRYYWAPNWNPQPTGVTLQVRLSNRGKGMAPREIFPLFTGGSFNSAYNDREPLDIAIPADVARAELVAITTGHGMEAGNCAEFCAHSHHYAVGASVHEQAFPEAATNSGCEETVSTGTVPNQAGTWWFGRGGWCPGRQVDPFVVDVSADVVPGGTTTFSYEGRLGGSTPPDGSGNIVHSSWLVIYR